MKNVSRNAPCPCGSGQKFKRCCLGKPAPLKGRRLLWFGTLALCVVGGGVTMGVFYGWKTGMGTAGVAALLAGILHVIRGAPPSGRGRGSASDINFGR